MKVKMNAEQSDSDPRFSVDIEIANLYDINDAEQGSIDWSSVRRVRTHGIVGTRASRLVISDWIADQLGLDLSKTTLVRYADGRRIERRLADHLCLSFGERRSYCPAVVEPHAESVLIGNLALWDLGVEIDAVNRQLIPHGEFELGVEAV